MNNLQGVDAISSMFANGPFQLQDVSLDSWTLALDANGDARNSRLPDYALLYVKYLNTRNRILNLLVPANTGKMLFESECQSTWIIDIKRILQMDPMNSTPKISHKTVTEPKNESESALKESGKKISNRESNNLSSKSLSDFDIYPFVFSVLSQESMTEKELEQTIECINKAFNYERAKKDEAKKQLASGDIFILLKSDGKVVGCAKCKRGSKVQSPSHKEQPLSESDFYLGQLSSTQRGAGKEVIRQAQVYAKNHGYDQLVLDVWEEPAHFLHKYYKNQGFREGSPDRVSFGEQHYFVLRYFKEL